MTQDILFDPDYWNRAHEVHAVLRAEGDVHRARMPNGVTVFVIGGHAAARAALADPRLSKDSEALKALLGRQLVDAGHSGNLSGMFAPHMMFRDGDAHTRLRRLVSAKFTPRMMEAMRPQIEKLTNELLDNLSELPHDHPVDVIDQFAFPLPVTVICDLLGVPHTDRDSLRRWTAALMEDDPDVVNPASKQMETYFAALIAAKRAKPGGDLLSSLVQVATEEDRLRPEELMGTVFLLFVAGHETTMNLIGNACRWLAADPQLWRRLSREKEVLPRAVDEVLRYDAPVRCATHRFTTEDVEYGGLNIPKGQVVLVSLMSANRDGHRFAHSGVLDLEREDVGHHLAFGYGIHYCLGATLGRMEAEIALAGLASRFPNARLAVDAGELQRKASVIMNGFKKVPVELGA